MNDLSASTLAREHETIDRLLQEAIRYGETALRGKGKGWSAHCSMYVTGKGASFEVRSEFGMSSPHAALLQLLERVNTALSKLDEIT